MVGDSPATIVGDGESIVGSPAQVINDHDVVPYEFVPITDLMRTALPANALISPEARECMVQCVSEFISFITGEGRSPA